MNIIMLVYITWQPSDKMIALERSEDDQPVGFFVTGERGSGVCV